MDQIRPYRLLLWSMHRIVLYVGPKRLHNIAYRKIICQKRIEYRTMAGHIFDLPFASALCNFGLWECKIFRNLQKYAYKAYMIWLWIYLVTIILFKPLFISPTWIYLHCYLWKYIIVRKIRINACNIDVMSS